MMLFVVWCTIVTAVQWEHSDLKASIKWMLPFMIYLLLRRMVRIQTEDFLRYLRNLVLGFGVIVAVNVAAILQGKGLYSVNYYTGFERYQGVFKDLHSMAHTIGFAIMLVFIYSGLQRAWRGPGALAKTKSHDGGVRLIVALAAFSLFKSNVRTVMIGLVVFFGVLLWLRNRRFFCVRGRTRRRMVAVWICPEIQCSGMLPMAREWGLRSKWQDPGAHSYGVITCELRLDLPFDQQITGLGVGNEIGVMPANGVITSEYRFRALGKPQ